MGFIFYFMVLFLSCISLELVYNLNNFLPLKKKLLFTKKRIFLFFFFISPIILTYTFRYSIGTDYFAYRTIFSDLHNVPITDYLRLHEKNIGSYYVETGFYVINRYLSFSYGSLLFVVSFLIFAFVYYGSIEVNENVNLAFVIFLYFCTQFIYSMNGVRFAIAITIIFFGVHFIIERKILGWVITVLLASSFHKTSIICAPLYLCTNFDSKKFSKLRDFLWYAFVIAFPLIAKILLMIASNISMFSRYFAVGKYALGNFTFKPMFLFHIIPVFLPLFMVKKSFILKDKKALILFRLSLFEIPLRELGSFNTWLSRLARFPQMFQLLFIPYILQNVKNPKTRLLLKIYYIVWYIFYFIYGALVNDAGDSIPYISIFSNGGNW